MMEGMIKVEGGAVEMARFGEVVVGPRKVGDFFIQGDDEVDFVLMDNFNQGIDISLGVEAWTGDAVAFDNGIGKAGDIESHGVGEEYLMSGSMELAS